MRKDIADKLSAAECAKLDLVEAADAMGRAGDAARVSLIRMSAVLDLIALDECERLDKFKP